MSAAVAPHPDMNPADAPGVTPLWQEKCRVRMDTIDRLSPEIRALVHEFDWTIVHQFLNCGVRDPRHIRHLIVTVLERSYGNGAGSQARRRCELVGASIAGNHPDIRDEAIAAFLRAAGVRS